MAVSILKGDGAILLIVDSTGGTKSVTADWIGGHPDVSDDVVDVAAIKDGGHRMNPALQNASLRFSFLMNPATAGTSAWEICSGLKNNNGSVRNLEHYPAGTASTKPKVTIPARCTRLVINGAVGDAETFDAEFSLDGTYTIGTV
jgi:hypothetical protein